MLDVYPICRCRYNTFQLAVQWNYNPIDTSAGGITLKLRQCCSEFPARLVPPCSNVSGRIQPLTIDAETFAATLGSNNSFVHFHSI